MTEQKLIFTQLVNDALHSEIERLNPGRVFYIADSNTARFVLPQLVDDNANVITIPAGDVNKTLESTAKVWKALTDARASRNDLIVNVGGGVVTDLGGFAAATYKRGLRFINIPTTLLAAVDAAVGGKTGVNFSGFKNQVGVFCNADSVIISTVYFSTLTADQVLSGYAEMIKHAMLTGRREFADVLKYNVSQREPGDNNLLLRLLQESVEVKRRIVAADPTEQGLRRALNLGHTVGHAFESLAMKRMAPIPHGFAVAYGLVVEAILSHMLMGFPAETMHQLRAYVSEHYSKFRFTCDDYPELLALMSQDKKNPDPQHISFTLLTDLGDPVTGTIVAEKDIRDALDIYREL